MSSLINEKLVIGQFLLLSSSVKEKFTKFMLCIKLLDLLKKGCYKSFQMFSS